MAKGVVRIVALERATPLSQPRALTDAPTMATRRGTTRALTPSQSVGATDDDRGWSAGLVGAPVLNSTPRTSAPLSSPTPAVCAAGAPADLYDPDVPPCSEHGNDPKCCFGNDEPPSATAARRAHPAFAAGDDFACAVVVGAYE